MNIINSYGHISEHTITSEPVYQFMKMCHDDITSPNLGDPISN